MSSPQCFYSANETVWRSPPYVVPYLKPSPHDPVVNCCGFDDTYLSNRLCYNFQTYYLSPCTDPKYKSRACPRYCQHRTDRDQLDVVYDARHKLWRCCKPGPPGSCPGVTDEKFTAPAPSDLVLQWPLQETKLSIFASPTTTPSSTSLVTHTAQASSGGRNSANIGTILGIVFGVLGASLALVVFYFSLRTYKLEKTKKARSKEQN